MDHQKSLSLSLPFLLFLLPSCFCVLSSARPSHCDGPRMMQVLSPRTQSSFPGERRHVFPMVPGKIGGKCSLFHLNTMTSVVHWMGLPRIRMLKPYPSMWWHKRWSLGEVSRIRWHHEGVMNEISSLIRVMGKPASPLCSQPRKDTRSWQSTTQKRTLVGTHPYWHTDLGLPESGTVRNKHLLSISHPVYRIVLGEPEWTKSFSEPVSLERRLCTHWLTSQV